MSQAESPFRVHRDKVLGHYATAAWLRGIVLSLAGEAAVPLGPKLWNVDRDHWTAFIEMVTHFHTAGPNDPAYVELLAEVQERQVDERTAVVRSEQLEAWCRTTRLSLRRIGKAPGDLDDGYPWFEAAFDSGRTADQAAMAWAARRGA